MNALENLLIIAGISLYIFAAMECQGSLVAKIDKKQLGKLCVLIAAWQMYPHKNTPGVETENGLPASPLLNRAPTYTPSVFLKNSH